MWIKFIDYFHAPRVVMLNLEHVKGIYCRDEVTIDEIIYYTISFRFGEHDEQAQDVYFDLQTERDKVYEDLLCRLNAFMLWNTL